MFRLIGFLFGVASTIVVLAALLDAPTRERAGVLATTLTTAIFDAVERLKRKYDVGDASPSAEPTAVRTTHNDFSDSVPTGQTRSIVAAATQTTKTLGDGSAVAQETVATAADRATNSASLPTSQGNTGPEASTVLADTTTSSAKELNWEPVWQAFRSELSAKGFAGHLKHLTGHEYRVRRTSPWAYQVELPYIDEGQRDAVLHEIQTKIGLGFMEAPP